MQCDNVYKKCVGRLHRFCNGGIKDSTKDETQNKEKEADSGI